MAHKCKNCPQLIHTIRTLCNKCNGVKPKAFEKAPTKTKGGYEGDKWVSSKEKARIAGIANALALLET